MTTNPTSPAFTDSVSFRSTKPSHTNEYKSIHRGSATLRKEKKKRLAKEKRKKKERKKILLQNYTIIYEESMCIIYKGEKV